MSPNDILRDADSKFQKALDHFEDEAKKLRTGRAHPGMLDSVTVMAYGTPMPLVQVATVSAPESQLLQITPFDPGNLQAISTAIRDNQSLGLNPSDDGRVVRIAIPPLTEERRRELVKVLSGKFEEAMIAYRNIRHEALSAVAEIKKQKLVSEDESKRYDKQVEDLMSQYKTKAEEVQKTKEADIMKV